MATNIEIKAVCPNLDKARLIAITLGAKPSLSQHQRDTYFTTPNGQLKLREIPGMTWLIPYTRPNELGAKRSDYEIISIDSPERTRGLLSQILGVSVVVEKERDIYLLDNVRIHLDEVVDLGSFIEFEAVFDASDPSAEETNRAKVDRLMIDFEIDQTSLIRQSYHDLLLTAAKASVATASAR